MGKSRTVTLWILLLAILALVLFVWQVPWQSQDGPNHRQVAELVKNWSKVSPAAEIYDNNTGPFQTNQIFPLLFIISPETLSSADYEKIFVGLFLIILVSGFFYFLKTWAPESLGFWPIILPFTFSLFFIQGMYNYLAGVALCFWGLAFLRRGGESESWVYLILYCLLTYLAFLSHPFPSFIFLTALLWLSIFENRERKFYLGCCWVVTLFFFVLGFALPLFQQSADTAGATFRFLYPWVNVGALFAFVFPLFSFVEIVLLLPFFLALLGLAIASLWKAPAKQRSIWLIFFILLLAFPYEGRGGGFINFRFIPFVWLFIPLGLKLSPRLEKNFLGLCIFTTLVLGTFTYHSMKLTERLAVQSRAVYQDIPLHAWVLPLNFNIRGHALNYHSWLHLWANYPSEKNIYTPYLFAHMELMPLSRKKNIQKITHPPESWASEIAKESVADWDSFAQKVENYPYWWVHQPPRGFEYWLGSNNQFKKIGQKGEISLWKNQRVKGFSNSTP